jgi:hypothetical protein
VFPSPVALPFPEDPAVTGTPFDPNDPTVGEINPGWNENDGHEHPWDKKKKGNDLGDL